MSQPSWIGYNLSGRYRIESLLGQGGMSAVYRATDPNLRRTVAVKLIHPHLSSDPEFVKRFEEEAAAVAQLRHPNIIQVFDFNHDNDTYYMVLEFLAGETLQARLKALSAAGKKLPLTETVRLMIKICEAVGYAHGRGMVHRDLKPANVMLNPQGDPILMDFGVAKIKGGQMQTATGAVIGTPMYMSPEQARGSRLDERSDLYSLGIILYEMAAGQPPFEADSAMSLMLKHLNEPVPDIGQFMGQAAPAELKAVIDRALVKDPEQRFQSAEEMVTALRAVGTQLVGDTLTSTASATAIAPTTAAPTATAIPVATAVAPPIPTVTQTQVPPPAPPTIQAQTNQGTPRKIPWLWAGVAGAALLIIIAIALIVPNLGPAAPAATPTSAPTDLPRPTITVPPTLTPAPVATTAPSATPAPSDTTVPPATVVPPTATVEPTATLVPAPEGMALIPGGTFTMGSTNRADERPEHQVTLSDFYLDIFEVSNDRYRACVDAGLCALPARRSSFTRGSYFDNPDFANHPVVFVTWEQANAFCAFENKRLPTEAEWEYAASGPEHLTWPWGNTFDAALSAASAGDTQAVDAYPEGVSPFGIFNMAGNVGEWVADRYATYSADAQTDPTGPDSGNARVFRGGSFGNTDRTFYTTTRRYSQGERFFVEDIGFRCAAEGP